MAMVNMEGGVGLSSSNAGGGNSTGSDFREFQIEPEHELRFEVPDEGVLTLSVVSGRGEVFGVELAEGEEYRFLDGEKVALFTWTGCRARLQGVRAEDVVYTATETPMPQYVNVHAVLHQMRLQAKDKGKVGPRVLIAGPASTGKSTLTRILVAYAVKTDSRVVYLQLDTADASMAIPGCIGATIVQHTDAVNGLLLRDTVIDPLVFFYGHSEPRELREGLELAIDALSQRVDTLLESRTEDLRHCGFIADSGNWIDGEGYDLISCSIRKFKIDCVLVLGAERLYAELNRDFGSQVQVVRLSPSGGVVSRDSRSRRADDRRACHQYFYGGGTMRDQLTPFNIVVGFDDIILVRVIPGPKLPPSALPVGAKPSLHSGPRVVRVPISQDLVHSLLGVFPKDATEESAVLHTPIQGFVKIENIDLDNRKITLLAPAPGPLPSPFLLLGSIKWLDEFHPTSGNPLTGNPSTAPVEDHLSSRKDREHQKQSNG
eukprot:CAMPEP_0184686526 /NCGR_PEP_ID=MMETSP0312-20130426/22801_1 /TAXON_ID=31354 /ORGANISM="Compsopogon coeruleus, Strain SAG 36.94" /LENGTH=487 /DNA_ID=CAMNT_0027141693 /DNA_START=25 /DNA_END=1485 /DNA_ORIENTATION=-